MKSGSTIFDIIWRTNTHRDGNTSINEDEGCPIEGPLNPFDHHITIIVRGLRQPLTVHLLRQEARVSWAADVIGLLIVDDMQTWKEAKLNFWSKKMHNLPKPMKKQLSNFGDKINFLLKILEISNYIDHNQNKQFFLSQKMVNALKPMKIKFPICIFEIWSILHSKFWKFTKMTTSLNFAYNYIKIHSRSYKNWKKFGLIFFLKILHYIFLFKSEQKIILRWLHLPPLLSSWMASHPTPGALCPGQFWCSTFLNPVHKESNNTAIKVPNFNKKIWVHNLSCLKN